MRQFFDRYHLFMNKVHDLDRLPYIEDRLRDMVGGRNVETKVV